MAIAVYPGTFDPITKGHVDVARRASRIFDRLIVAIGANPAKTPLFSIVERVEIARAELKDLRNVAVESFHGLLVEYLKAKGIAIVVRGIRSPGDFEYEYKMALTNRAMLAGAETLFILASPEYAFLNSQLIREIAQAGGDVSPFVSELVAQRLSGKLQDRSTRRKAT